VTCPTGSGLNSEPIMMDGAAIITTGAAPRGSPVGPRRGHGEHGWLDDDHYGCRRLKAGDDMGASGGDEEADNAEQGGWVLLADFLRHRHRDPFVPNRRADPQRQRHANDDPRGHVLDRLAEAIDVRDDRLADSRGDADPAEVPTQAKDRLTGFPTIGGRNLVETCFTLQVRSEDVEIASPAFDQFTPCMSPQVSRLFTSPTPSRDSIGRVVETVDKLESKSNDNRDRQVDLVRQRKPCQRRPERHCHAAISVKDCEMVGVQLRPDRSLEALSGEPSLACNAACEKTGHEHRGNYRSEVKSNDSRFSDFIRVQMLSRRA
jgi:hypothetical protein